MKIREIVVESSKPVEQAVAVYGGRFQPMHRGHFQLYKTLVSNFGASNVFIATMFGKRQQVDHAAGNYSTDPFTFEEKQLIISTMFQIPKEHIVNTSPYRPDLSMMGIDTNKTALVLAYSDKDENRLSGGSIKPWPGLKKAKPVSTGSLYTVELPANYDDMSATDFREVMSDPKASDKKKQQYFKKYFGSFNQEIYDLVKGRLEQ